MENRTVNTPCGKTRTLTFFSESKLPNENDVTIFDTVCPFANNVEGSESIIFILLTSNFPGT